MSSFSFAALRQKPTLLEWAVIAAIVVVLICLLLPGGDFDTSHRYPPAIPDAGLDLSDIAGEYHKGFGRGAGWCLSILPDGRYSTWLGVCTGVCNRESGYVWRLGADYELSPTTSTGSRIDRNLFPIRWGGRSYLIASDRMQEFCDAIINGDEPHDGERGGFYLREPTVRVDGLPELPEEWAAYLRDHLVIGRIVEASEGGHARLDLGSADGIEKGDMMTVQGSGRFNHRRVKVESIQQRSSVVVDPNWQPKEPILPAGRCVVMRRDFRGTTMSR
jgi:hypothetical protein